MSLVISSYNKKHCHREIPVCSPNILSSVYELVSVQVAELTKQETKTR